MDAYALLTLWLPERNNRYYNLPYCDYEYSAIMWWGKYWRIGLIISKD